jgi:hypothetical protein
LTQVCDVRQDGNKLRAASHPRVNILFIVLPVVSSEQPGLATGSATHDILESKELFGE